MYRQPTRIIAKPLVWAVSVMNQFPQHLYLPVVVPDQSNGVYKLGKGNS